MLATTCQQNKILWALQTARVLRVLNIVVIRVDETILESFHTDLDKWVTDRVKQPKYMIKKNKNCKTAEKIFDTGMISSMQLKSDTTSQNKVTTLHYTP